MRLRLTATDIEVKMFPPKPGHYVVKFITPDLSAMAAFVDGRMPEKSTVTISDEKKRSLDANAYMWVLLDKIAAKQRTTAKEIYREIIKDVGVYDWIMVTPEAKDAFIRTWEERGDGWVAIEYPAMDKGVPLKVFYGSSTYNTAQMSRLIDEVIHAAKEDGIETLTPDELLRLKEAI